MRFWFVALTLSLPLALLAACRPVSRGPIPGQDPIVGKWHHGQIGTTTFAADGRFLPDPHFADRCAGVPQVRAEKERCAEGRWESLGDGSYAVVMPNFTTVSSDGDGAHDCQCAGVLQVVARVDGNNLSLGPPGGPPRVSLERR